MKIIILYFFLCSLNGKECPELIHIDYTDYDKIWVEMFFPITPVQGDYENAIYDKEEIQEYVDKIFNNLVPRSLKSTCQDSDVFPKFCGIDDSIFFNPDNFTFEAIVPPHKNEVPKVELSKLLATPKCHIRDIVKYPILFNIYSTKFSNEYEEIISTCGENVKFNKPVWSTGYQFLVFPRIYYKDDADIPWFFSPKKYVYGEGVECPELLSVFQDSISDFDMKKFNITDSLLIKEKFDTIRKGRKLYINAYTIYTKIHPTIHNIDEDEFLKYDNFNFERLYLEKDNEKSKSYHFIATPKCHFRKKIPYQLEIIYDSSNLEIFGFDTKILNIHYSPR